MKSALLAVVVGLATVLSAHAEFAKSATFTVAGYNGSSELANMPVLVRLAKDMTADCRDDGADIQFTSEDGAAVYPHEIDVWNRSGESLVWVKLPILKKGVQFKLNYSDANYTGPVESQAKGAVWDDAGYVGVWHMNQQSGSEPNMTSAANFDAVVVKGTNADSDYRYSSAPIGYSRHAGAKKGNENSYCSYFKVPSFDLGSTYIVSGWMRMTDYDPNWNGNMTRNARIFSCKEAWNAEGGGFDISHASAINTLNVRGSGGTTVNPKNFPNPTQDWVFYSFVFNGARFSSYANGAPIQDGSGTIAEATSSGKPMGIGSNPAGNDHYAVAAFDEVRLMDLDENKSEDYYKDWIQAEYETAHNPDFLTVKVEIPPFDKTAYALAAPFAVGYEWPDGAVDADKANLPVLVRVKDGQPSGFNYGNCAADGSDIAFCSADGETEYAFDVDTWNPEGESCFWVRLPDASKDASFLMLFGGIEKMMARSRPETVWSDYVGVWHLGEASGLAKDSTGHGLTGTPSGNASGKSASEIMVAYPKGVVGAARVNGKENGSSLTYMSVPSYDSYGLGDSFTISGWFLANGISGWPRLFSRKNHNADNDGFEIEIYSGSKTAAQARGATSTSIPVSWPDLTADWMYLTLVYDGATLTAYANGVDAGSGTIVAATDNGKPLSFGGNSNNSEASFNGQYDEIRLCDGAKGAVRVAAEYATMHDAPDKTFLTSTGVTPSPFIEANSFVVSCDLEEFVTDITTAHDFSPPAGVTPLTGDLTVTAPSGEVTTADGRKFRVKSWELFETVQGEDEKKTNEGTGAPNFTYDYTIGTDARLLLKLEAYLEPTKLGPGEVSGAGWFGLGDPVTLTATGDDFSGWFEGSDRLSTEKTYSFEFVRTVAACAVFKDMVNLVPDVHNPPVGATGQFFDDFAEALKFATLCHADTITVYPSSGNYLIKDNAVLPAGLALVGVKNANGGRPTLDFNKTGTLTANGEAEITGFGFANAKSSSTPIVLKADTKLTDCLVSGLGDYFYIVSAEGQNVEITNCTFTNCVSQSAGAGVVNCMSGSSVLIEDVVVDGCKQSTGQYGGVFHTENVGGIVLTVRRCRVANSVARNAMFRIDGGRAIVENSLFVNNEGNPSVLACNSADQGGTKFTNCTFYGNEGTLASLRCVFDSCILWTRSGVATVSTTTSQWEHLAQINYCCYREATDDDGKYGTGNISDEPTFKDGTYEPLINSPYVNKGNPKSAWTVDDVDLAGNRRVRGPCVDMGCFEFQPRGFSVIIR